MNNFSIFSKFLCFFSSKAREKCRKEEECRILLEGQQLWQQINRDLPKAYGVIFDDEPRIQAFKKLVKTFSPRQKCSLIKWLNHEIKEWDYNFCEITTGIQEEYERRQLQIFREHLQVLQS